MGEQKWVREAVEFSRENTARAALLLQLPQHFHCHTALPWGSGVELPGLHREVAVETTTKEEGAEQTQHCQPCSLLREVAGS